MLTPRIGNSSFKQLNPGFLAITRGTRTQADFLRQPNCEKEVPMTTSARSRATTAPARWRQITTATVLGTTVAFGIAVGSASVATAQSIQQKADIYAECLNAGFSVQACCVKSGGSYSLTIDKGKTVESCFWEPDKPNSPGPARTAIIPSQITGATSLK